MIQTETTSKRSSTRTHTESITDQGFMSMKTKEIRDSESPTEEYQRQSNLNKNVHASSKNEESIGSRGIVQIEQNNSIKPSEEYTHSSLQTSVSNSSSSKWESTQTIVSVSEEVQKSEVDLSSQFVINEKNNENNQLTYSTSFNKSNNSNINNTTSESIPALNYDNIKQEDNSHYSNDHHKVVETYTNASSNDVIEPKSESISNKNSNFTENVYISDVSTNKSENNEKINDDKTIINELQKLDSYLLTQHSTADSCNKLNSTHLIEEKVNTTVDNQLIDTAKENAEGQYNTTYQQSYQQPRISVDLSPSHEAFARSLRSTPERSSPSPCRDRTSPERKFKSASPEKYRASPEKSASPPKSLKSSSRRKLSSTHTKDLSKKRANTPTRGEKYDSSDDSDCSGATHGTYDKYKDYDAKRTLFKEETKTASLSKYSKKSPSTSPVRREKSPGYSSEGSVGKEVIKASNKIKSSSHESSPERSAFKPVKNYKTTQTQNATQNSKTVLKTKKEDVTYSYAPENNVVIMNNFVQVIKPEIEDDTNTNEEKEESEYNTTKDTLNSKYESSQEKMIIEEQNHTSSEQVNNVNISKTSTQTEINRQNREKSPSKSFVNENKFNQEQFIENEKINLAKENTKINDITSVKPKEKSPIKELKSVKKDPLTSPTTKTTDKISHVSNNKSAISSKKTISAIPSPSTKKTIPSSLEKTPSKKSLVHKDSRENLIHKTVKKDLSREKMEIKNTKNDSKSLIHKNSKESITSKTVVKKPSQELLIDKKTTISFRNKVTSPESKPKIQEPKKTIEKKDSANKIKPTISPQSSQKKLGIGKLNTETKTVTDSKKITDNNVYKKIPSSSVSKPKSFTATKPNINVTPSKGTKMYSKTIPTSSTTKPIIKKTVPSTQNKTNKVEITKTVEIKTVDLENELPPDNFESDTDFDDSSEKPNYGKARSFKTSTHSTSSSSSSEEEEEEDEDVEDRQKIEELDNMRIKAEEEYGKKMTNKDALLNVVVQLPQSSRESSPEYSARFGQPYCSVSDDASLPRYADVVSEPEDVNDYRLSSNRYDIVTDLDEESNVTVADRVSKFLNNVNKQDEIKTTEIPQSPRAVKKTKQIFESIAKGQVEETDIYDDEQETINNKVHDSSKSINTQSSLLTRKISGASDYKTRKEFFEKPKSSDAPEKVTLSTPKSITRSSSIKDRRASFESKIDKKTPLKDKTNVPRSKSPESKNSSPDRTTKSPTKFSKTEVFDVKVEKINKTRKLSGSKSVKDRTANFERNEFSQKSTKENKSVERRPTPNSSVNTTTVVDKRDTKNSEIVSTKRVTSPNRINRSPERKTAVRNETNESSNKKVLTKSPERKITETSGRNITKSPERSILKNTKENNNVNRRSQDTSISSVQRTTTTKTEFGGTIKNTPASKTTTTTKTTSINNIDDEAQIEEIFDLYVLEIMVNIFSNNCFLN